MVSEYPYEFEEVNAVLIEGMGDFTVIQRGSLKHHPKVVENYGPAFVEGEHGSKVLVPDAFTCVDSFDGETMYFFANRLLAVKFSTEPPAVVQQVEDGRLLP